ncbi:MAG TPA: (4Fe-4S)-binding protein [Spirochaetia bacterium]|nr:MAG: hypothetical protein A2Y41_09400 [Spirochaetes bacterium GWB1_36_13]HCL56629.1 (4Fe-4S)-binding protein [Spirochaetia bacterium]
MNAKEIVFISGKGGAGKTTIMASIAYLAGEKALISDCDVDAADLFILALPAKTSSVPFYGMEKAVIDQQLCIRCEKCFSVCRFDAVKREKGRNKCVEIDLSACQSCGRCMDVCPVDALRLEKKERGKIISGTSRFHSPMIYGVLEPGEENSGKLVTEVRNLAKNEAQKFQKKIILIDGPPGIGCPAIASIGNTHLVVIITEASLSGFHDAKRALSLARKMNLKTAAVFNKTGLNPDLETEMRDFFSQSGVEILASFPFSAEWNEILRERQTIAETHEPFLKQEIQKLYQNLLKTIGG